MAVTPRQSAMQRLKVGVFCFALVLLVVSISNVMLERSAETAASVTVSEEPNATVPDENLAPEDPLAEMGATPSVEPEAEKAEPAALPDAELDGPNTATVE